MKLKDLARCICGICGGENAWPMGWAPPGGRIIWSCDACWPVAAEAHRQQCAGISHDREARNYAGEVAGAYLETLGTTDLAVLTPEQWAKFLDTLFRAKQAELRRLYSPTAPALV